MSTTTRTPAFESIERLGKKAAKVATQIASEVTQDAKESLLGDIKPMSPEEKQQAIQDEHKKKQHMQTVRQNIATIEQQMEEIRKKRQHQDIQTKQVAKQQQEQKKVEKKHQDSILAKLIKSRTGTKEGMQRASG